jgi:hypothetical protein
VGVYALVRILTSSSLLSSSGLLILEGVLYLIVCCFHFLIVALVPNVNRCHTTSRDLRFKPSGSLKATTREEEEPAI